MGAVGWTRGGGEFMFRHPGCWGSVLGQGSQEDRTLMLWRLRGDFRLKREKRAALHSGQFPLPILLFFSLGARTSLPPTTAGTVIHLQSGENTEILGTCSLGSDLLSGGKSLRSLWLLGKSQGVMFGNSPNLVSGVKMFSCPGSKWVWFPCCRI